MAATTSSLQSEGRTEQSDSADRHRGRNDDPNPEADGLPDGRSPVRDDRRSLRRRLPKKRCAAHRDPGAALPLRGR